jgi:hypothetical protein
MPIAFPLQQYLYVCAWMLRYRYTAHLGTSARRPIALLFVSLSISTDGTLSRHDYIIRATIASEYYGRYSQSSFHIACDPDR